MSYFHLKYIITAIFIHFIVISTFIGVLATNFTANSAFILTNLTTFGKVLEYVGSSNSPECHFFEMLKVLVYHALR